MKKPRWHRKLALLAAITVLLAAAPFSAGSAKAAGSVSGNQLNTAAGSSNEGTTPEEPTTGASTDGENQSGGIVNEQPNTSLTIIPSNANALVLMDVGAQSPKGVPGNVVDIVLPIAVNREYLPSEKYVLRNITIQPVMPSASKDASTWPFDAIDASYTRHLDDMSYNSTAEVWYKFRISEFATKGVYPVNFKVSATVWRQDDANGTTIEEDVTFTLGVYVTITDDGGLSGVTSAIGPLEIGGFGDGIVNNSPITEPGQSITLTLPIVNKGGYLSRITVSPVVSASIEEFPFVVDKLAYGITLPDMNTGDTQTFTYTFNVSPYATTGNKPVTFRASYEENGIAGECTFTAYIYVKNGYEEPKEITETPPVATVTEYTMWVDGKEVDHLNAGEDAVIKMTVMNNSVKSTIIATSATITIGDPTALTLTAGSSDTAYLGTLKHEETSEAEFMVSVPANAPVGATNVSVNLTYENVEMISKTVTQNIMIPVKQPMNMLIDEPEVHGTPRTDDPFAVTLNIINMGRSKVLNLSVNAMDGISMAETYYGGDVLPAGSISADIELTASKSGEFTGTLLVSYEDSDGELYTQYIDLPLSVVQAVEVTEPAAEVSAQPEDNGVSAAAVAGWSVLGLAAAGTAGFFGVKEWRRRKGL